MKSLSTFAIQLYHTAPSFNLSSLQKWGGQVEAPLRGDSLGHDTAIQSAQHITQC